jgi:hypothetical protein
MSIFRREDGAALVTALMLTMMAFVISMALLYSVTTGTRISASQKRYRSALAAAHGGVELLTQEIIPRLFQADPLGTSLINDFKPIDLKLPQYACLQQKLNNPTANWGSCNASSDPAESPDVTFRLSSDKSTESFSVSSKIIDTVPGNSDKNGSSGSDFLDPGSSVAGKDEGIVHPQHVPGLYNLSVQGVRDGGNVREKARLSVLYAY